MSHILLEVLNLCMSSRVCGGTMDSPSSWVDICVQILIFVILFIKHYILKEISTLFKIEFHFEHELLVKFLNQMLWCSRPIINVGLYSIKGHITFIFKESMAFVIHGARCQLPTLLQSFHISLYIKLGLQWRQGATFSSQDTGSIAPFV